MQRWLEERGWREGVGRIQDLYIAWMQRLFADWGLLSGWVQRWSEEQEWQSWFAEHRWRSWFVRVQLWFEDHRWWSWFVRVQQWFEGYGWRSMFVWVQRWRLTKWG